MTEQKQPEALRLAKTLEALGDYNFNTEAAAELRRQHAEIMELRAKLEELAKQEPFIYCHYSGVFFKQLAPGVGGLPLYLAAGARPVEPAPVQVTKPSICTDCSNADSWGLPDKPCCRSCVSGNNWQSLNTSSVNPNGPAQPAPADGWLHSSGMAERACREIESLRMRPQEASYTSVQLAEMILSDCGCSANNTSLLERVAKRIDRHSDTLPLPAPAAKPVEAQQPGMAPATLPDERATFEAWISKDGGDLSTFGSGRNIHYSNSAVNNAWTGWKARASHWQAPAQPAPAAVVGPTNKVLWLLMAQYGLNMTVGQDMDNLLNFGRDVWNAALSTIQPAPAAQDDSKRLDFLDENLQMKMGWGVGKAPAGNVSVWSLIQPAGATSIRVAIDAARAADKKEPT